MTLALLSVELEYDVQDASYSYLFAQLSHGAKIPPFSAVRKYIAQNHLSMGRLMNKRLFSMSLCLALAMTKSVHLINRLYSEPLAK